MTDDPPRSAAESIRTDDTRCPMEPWGPDTQPLLGRGPYPPHSAWAAVTHRQLGCCASALRPPLRPERPGAPGHRTRDKAADTSTAAAQEQLRSRLWEDLSTSLKEALRGQPLRDERERLRVASPEHKSVTVSDIDHCRLVMKGLLHSNPQHTCQGGKFQTESLPPRPRRSTAGRLGTNTL